MVHKLEENQRILERMKGDANFAIQEMSKMDGNNECADCGKSEIDWGNLTTGTFLQAVR